MSFLRSGNGLFLSHITRNLTVLGTMSGKKTIEASIVNKLNVNLNPIHLDIINESFMHNVPKGSETHFKVVVVSDKFDNVSLIKRHRMINDFLKYELENGVHALSIVAKTPSEWSKDNKVNQTPKCLGGFGK